MELSKDELTALAKRLQSALKRRNIEIALGDIKDTILPIVEASEHIFTNDVQPECMNALVQKYQSTALSVPEISPTPTPISVLSPEQKNEMVTTQAAAMGIQLSEQDIIYVADQINTAGSTLDEIISEVESTLIAFADYKKAEGINKINQMFGRVQASVGNNNIETSAAIAEGLQNFGRVLDQQQQDFKSSVVASLQHLKIKNPA